jgi:predicted ATPase
MIKQWSVSNFKSIRDRVRIEFAPLTLFVGQNSAGKSTLIQSILLTAQTIQSNVTARSVILNGRIIRLGAFSDIRSNNSADENVTVSFEIGRPSYEVEGQSLSLRSRYYFPIDYQDQMKLVTSSFTFSAGPSQEQNRELQLQPRLEGGNICYRSVDTEKNFEFEFKRQPESNDSMLEKLGVLPENVRIPDPTALDFQAVGSSGLAKTYRRSYRLPLQTMPAGVLLRHFLPVGVAAAYDALEVEVNSIFDVLIDANSNFRFRNEASDGMTESLSSPELPIIFGQACLLASAELVDTTKVRIEKMVNALEADFSFQAIAKIQAALQSPGRKALAIQLTDRESELKELIRAGRVPRREISAFPTADPTSYASEYLTNFFTDKLKYLGPLRDEPKAIYPLAGYNDPKDIGFRGEFTAAVLDNNKTANVTYIPSSQFPFSEQSKIRPVRTDLVSAVRDWLEYLGIASKVATEDKGKLGHELTIATSNGDHLHDLTHVGVGVSQALPIVVLSLLADTGSTLIFEQPELHLHPRVQTRLADFFMSLTFAGKQCVVETHSEYLVSRLRYLSAMAKDVPISQLIKIYFVEKPAEQSIYSEVKMTESGVIRNWPDGFFDETERNSAAIIQAQLERARANRQRGDSGVAK